MEPILTTVALTLASKFTVTYITETVLGGWLGNRADSIITDKIPSLSKRILAQFKDMEIPVNNHLQKAVLSSHWLATKVFAEQLKKTNNSPVFKRIIHIADEQLNLLKKEDYQLEALNSETYETDLFIFKNEDNNLRTLLREKVIDNHLLILFDLLRTYKKDNPEWIVFQNTLTNGLISKNIDWFELACSFLNELMKGDNNKAKDAFQNQELAKIAFGVAGLKEELMLGFETLANQYVQGIGEDQFNEYVDWLCEDLKEIKGSLNRIEITTTETNTIVKRIEEGIIELQGLQKKELNLNYFPDYRTLLTDIEAIDSVCREKQTEVKETLELLEEESNERKRDRFTKDLNRLEQELLELDSTRANKQNEFEDFKRNIEKTWLSLYADDVPDSPRLVKARELFEAGNLQAANAVLDPQLLQQDYDLLKKAKDSIQQKEEILAQEYLTKANFTVLAKADNNWFIEAKEYYQKAVELHKNYDNCFAIALFLQEHKQIIEAIEWYRKTLSLSQKEIENAKTLNNLAILQNDKNDFENAFASYQEALGIYIGLARVNPQVYLPDVGMTLNNLGNLQRAKKDFENASISYQEALVIRREFARVNPQVYLPDVGMTLNNLGNLQRAKKDFENASISYQEALVIRQEFARVNPQVYLPDVAMTLNNLAVLQSDKNDFDNAVASCQEALDIYRRFARLNPQVYLPDVAMTLNNLGSIQRAKNDFEKASTSYQEALSIYRTLARLNSQAYLPDVAMTLNNLGSLQSAKKDFGNASVSCKEALDIYREFASANPQVYLPDVAMTLNSLGSLQRVNNDFETALLSYQEALAIRREFASANPQVYLPDVAMTLNNLAVLQSDNNDFKTALSSYQEALAIRREFASANPEVYLPDVAMTLNNLGNLWSASNDFKTALLSYQEALGIYRELAMVNPHKYLPDVATTLNNLSVLQKEQHDFGKALSGYQEALGIYREFVRVNPQMYLPYVAIILNNLGLLQSVNNDFEKKGLSSYQEAFTSYQEALSIRSELVRVNPSAFQMDLAETLINLAIFHLYCVVDKEKSLDFAYHAFLNAESYHQHVAKALRVCQTAWQIWKAWEEDLEKYLEDNNE